MKNECIKTLLSAGKYSLKDLHDVLGFDFCAPFGAYMVKGRFTIKQVEKLIGADDYNYGNSVIAICTRDKSKPWEKRFHLVTFTHSAISICARTPYRADGWGLDTFYRKSDFESVRKSDSAETVIFAQLDKHIKKPCQRAFSLDTSERYKLLDYDYCHVVERNKKYINRLHLQEMGTNGKKIDYDIIGRVFCSGANYAENIDQVIDKSGYFVQLRRADLKRRAAALRADREKAKFAISDNTAKIEELQKLIDERKQEIILNLTLATTADEFKAVGDSIGLYKGFADTVRAFEHLKEKDASKSYRSISEFEQAYTKIRNALTTEEVAI